MHIGIIGAGITGVTTAYYLSKNGINIDLIESRRYPAMATSYANGGQLSASNSEAWNSWSSVYTGIKGLFKKDSSIKINPKLSIDKYHWLLSFIRNIPLNEKITENICKMAIKSINLYSDIAENEKIKFDLLNKGILHFYYTEEETRKAILTNKIYKRAGLIRERLTHEELYNVEPALEKKKFDSIFYTKTDKTGDIHKFCINLTKTLLKSKNIRLISKEVTNLNEELKKYDKLVVCAGVNSKKLAATVGEKLLIYPVKGYSITVNNPGRNAPWVSLLDDKSKIVTSRLGQDRLRIAGTAELNGYNLDIIQNRIRPLIKWCNTMFPKINSGDIKPWAGLRPMTPNMMPIIKFSTDKRIWYNTGHGHLGWTLSAYTACETARNIIK